MRRVLAMALLSFAALAGIDHLSAGIPMKREVSAEAAIKAELIAETSSKSAPPAERAATSNAGSGVLQTIAAADQPSVKSPLPPVKGAENAPRAEQIEPLVEPMKRPPPKTVPDAKAHHAATKPNAKPQTGKLAKPHAKPAAKSTGVTVTRPGFKLTCTKAQKLDVARQRCIPVKKPG